MEDEFLLIKKNKKIMRKVAEIFTSNHQEINQASINSMLRQKAKQAKDRIKNTQNSLPTEENVEEKRLLSDSFQDKKDDHYFWKHPHRFF